MTLEQFLKELSLFIQLEVRFILVELQQKRFENHGKFNDHEEWAPNVRPDIKYEKYEKPPLIDSGELMKELTDPANWNVVVEKTTNKLMVTFPDVENFTDSKYDQLEDDSGGSYYGGRTGKLIKFKSKPPRKFKALSQQDVEWVVKQLEKSIRERYEK